MDVTMQIIEAQDARARMQDAKKRIKSEVRRKYEARMAQEIAEASQDAEIEFARTLARVHAAGVSQALLRREVLRTNVWSVWTYWRDLANIEPERISTAAAKAANTKNASGVSWVADDSEFGYHLIISKDRKGKDIPEAVFETLEIQDDKIVIWSDLNNHPEHKEIGEKYFSGGWNLYKFATEQANAHREEINK